MPEAKLKRRDIGLEAGAPENDCTSEKCPWHGYLKVRGRKFKGRVVSSKAPGTAVVEWDYYHYSPKYERYERRHSRVAASNPACISAREGDTVLIAECRPLSKSKRFVVIQKLGLLNIQEAKLSENIERVKR